MRLLQSSQWEYEALESGGTSMEPEIKAILFLETNVRKGKTMSDSCCLGEGEKSQLWKVLHIKRATGVLF